MERRDVRARINKERNSRSNVFQTRSQLREAWPLGRGVSPCVRRERVGNNTDWARQPGPFPGSATSIDERHGGRSSAKSARGEGVNQKDVALYFGRK